jgi:hypothetical protein
VGKRGHKKCPDQVDERDQENGFERQKLPEILAGVQTGSIGALAARRQECWAD